MLDMNMWCFNSRVWPGIEPMVARQGDKVRMRFGSSGPPSPPGCRR
jgi:hypothetical protein